VSRLSSGTKMFFPARTIHRFPPLVFRIFLQPGRPDVGTFFLPRALWIGMPLGIRHYIA